MAAPWHMRRRERKFNPETPPLRQWPFMFDDKSHQWAVEWNEVFGFLIGFGLVAAVVFIFGTLLYLGLVEIL